MPNQVQYVTPVLKAQFDPTLLTSSYQVMNLLPVVGFSDSVKILKIWNPSTTIAIDVSYDGVNDHDFLPPLATLIVDFQTNHETTASYGTGTKCIKMGQQIWGKTAAHPTFVQIIGYN
jgi:hypothetical protein